MSLQTKGRKYDGPPYTVVEYKGCYFQFDVGFRLLVVDWENLLNPRHHAIQGKEFVPGIVATALGCAIQEPYKRPPRHGFRVAHRLG